MINGLPTTSLDPAPRGPGTLRPTHAHRSLSRLGSAIGPRILASCGKTIKIMPNLIK